MQRTHTHMRFPVITPRVLRIGIALYILAALAPFARDPLATLLAYRSESYYVYGHNHAAHRYLQRARWLDPSNHDVEDLEAFAIGTTRSHPSPKTVARRAALALRTHDQLAIDNYALVYFRSKHYRTAWRLLRATHASGVWLDMETLARRRIAMKHARAHRQ